jgi:hypothetical protein
MRVRSSNVLLASPAHHADPRALRPGGGLTHRAYSSELGFCLVLRMAMRTEVARRNGACGLRSILASSRAAVVLGWNTVQISAT